MGRAEKMVPILGLSIELLVAYDRGELKEENLECVLNIQENVSGEKEKILNVSTRFPGQHPSIQLGSYSLCSI